MENLARRVQNVEDDGVDLEDENDKEHKKDNPEAVRAHADIDKAEVNIAEQLGILAIVLSGVALIGMIVLAVQVRRLKRL